MEKGTCRWPLDPPAQVTKYYEYTEIYTRWLAKATRTVSYTIILSFRESLYIYYVYTHTCRCINDNDDKINQQYIRIIINITRYIYRYIYVYRYRPCHRMLIAKDQPCSACIVKHGFSNQTGFVRHSSRSDRAPCKRTVKTYKRTRTTRRCVVEILWRIIRSRILISTVSI